MPATLTFLPTAGDLRVGDRVLALGRWSFSSPREVLAIVVVVAGATARVHLAEECEPVTVEATDRVDLAPPF